MLEQYVMKAVEIHIKIKVQAPLLNMWLHMHLAFTFKRTNQRWSYTVTLVSPHFIISYHF